MNGEPAGAALGHCALLYRSDEEYLRHVVPFLAEGVAAGQPTLALLAPARLELLRAELDGQAHAVEMVDVRVAGRNPAALAGLVHRFLRTAEGAARMVGEPAWPDQNAAERGACAQYEAAGNLALSARPLQALCLYDAANLSAEVLADARATHPELIVDGRHAASTAYAPEEVLARHNLPLPFPTGSVAREVASPEELSSARRWAEERALALGVDGERIAVLQFVLSELLANALRHGGGCGELRLWREGPDIVCRVHDRGRLLDPLAGRRWPDDAAPGGRGLMLVHQLARLVRMHSDSTGTTVHAHV